MKLAIFTICLDAMPMITWHLPVFNTLGDLNVDWHWYIAEGAAMNVKDTAWCKPQSPRLSMDSTTAYLNAISRHPRITVLQRQSWNGKVEMCNACLEQIKAVEPHVLLEVDADELWTADAIHKLTTCLSETPNYNCARFFCRFFVGPNIVSMHENSYGNNPGEWLRAWIWAPGARFIKHEPPVLAGVNDGNEHCLKREVTDGMGLRFEHYAYAFRQQVAYKEKFYGYTDAVKHWERLQANTTWPVKRLKDFLPWVDERADADILR